MRKYSKSIKQMREEEEGEGEKNTSANVQKHEKKKIRNTKLNIRVHEK